MIFLTPNIKFFLPEAQHPPSLPLTLEHFLISYTILNEQPQIKNIMSVRQPNIKIVHL